MRWPAVTLGAVLGACAHQAAVMRHPTPRGPVAPSVAVSAPRIDAVRPAPVPKVAPPTTPHHCDTLAKPALPDPGTAPDLSNAVSRLAAREKLRDDYEQRLAAALKACGN